MNSVIAILTVVSIFGHAIVGCCSHTVHFAASHELPAVSGAHAGHGESHHHCHDTTVPGNHAPGEDHDCDHAKCQWVASSGSIDLALTSPFTAVGVMCAEVSTQIFATLTQNLTTLAESPPAPPVRSHLALGVLLI